MTLDHDFLFSMIFLIFVFYACVTYFSELFSACDIPMGLTNPLVISNTQLTASSSLDILHYPSRGRLYTSKDGSLAGGWSPR